VDEGVDKDIHRSMTVFGRSLNSCAMRLLCLQDIDFDSFIGIIPESRMLHNHSNNLF
jgi:hypothetical protein